MTVSVIVPNYNGIVFLRDCIISLLNHDRVPEQIIVVDNGSSDGSADIVRDEFPKIVLVALDSNTGFTGANNAGLNAATGDFLVLLNNDCIVEDGWLTALLKHMEDQSVAAVTSSMRNISDINMMDSAGGEIDWMGFSRDIGKGEAASKYNTSIEIPFPSGGAVMIRRSALPDGSRLFWDRLFLYQEDLDLGFELRRSGWKVVYAPCAVVRHMHSATSVSGSFIKEYSCIRNRLLVLRKHFDAETFRKLRPYIKFWQYLWFLLSILRGRFTLAKSVLKGTHDGFKIPVETLNASISVNEIFSRFATCCDSTNPVKKYLYKKAKEIISLRCV